MRVKLAKLPKPIKSKNPVVILRHVIKAIREEPKRYDQGTFIETQDGQSYLQNDEFPACGTIACVAGWVNIVTGHHRVSYDRMSESARRLLKLGGDEADRLFDGEPVGVTPRHYDDMTPEKHAAQGIRHIKRFVKAKWGVTLKG